LRIHYVYIVVSVWIYMAETPTYEVDEFGYPTDVGIIEMLRHIAESMPRGTNTNNLFYAIGYIKHSLGLGDE